MGYEQTQRTRRHRGTRSVGSMMPRSRTLYRFILDDWDTFKSICNRRWDKTYENLLEGSFSMRKVLGSGYFGVVMSTRSKKLVVKVTSDADEGYFNQLILNDPELRFNPGLPYIVDCFHIPEWGAYIILRENVQFGIEKLPQASPLARSIDILDLYGEQAMRIESRVAKMLRSSEFKDHKISKNDFVYAYREAQGLIRTEIIKTLKKLPHTSENSKYFWSMDVIRHSLDKYGIALWDLHSLNLGKHKYDLSDIIPDAPPLDTESILILDVGGNFGSPIMTQMIEEIEI